MTIRALLIALALGSAAIAQPVQPLAAPDLSEIVLRSLEAPYLSAQERARLRLFHGLWTEEELDSPAARATAAAIRGAWDDPSFSDIATPVLDRAQAALRRGDAALALSLAREGTGSTRSVRLEAEALEALGRRAEAAGLLREIDPRGGQGDAPELVERALALFAYSRLRDEPTTVAEYRAMLALLAGARDRVDRLYWPAILAEAHILLEKDNAAQAQEAAAEVLTLNPRCADAWALLGRVAVDGFDVDRALAIAARLDRLESEGGAWASNIRAGARARQNDAQGALDALAPALARFPDALPTRLAEIGAIARTYDAARLQASLDRFDALRPASGLGLLAAGKALAEARQYAEAAERLRQARDRDPWAAEPWIELGLLAIQAADDAEALASLRRAAELDPFNVRAGNSLALMEELVTYSRIETDHFTIRFKPGLDEVLASEMGGILEEIHATVAGETGLRHEPRVKTLIELMPDHRWFSVRIAGLPRIHTMAAATGPAIAMESPREGRGHMVGPYDWPRVLQHEYTHTVTLSRTLNRIPHWFTEASAVHMERAPRAFDRCQLLARALAEGTLFTLDEISLKFVRPERPTDRAQAYSQGHWMYEYMVEGWGDDAPLALMDLYAEGITESEAIPRILGVPPEGFMNGFIAWAHEQVRAWGLLPPADGPTLSELLAREIDPADVQARLEAHAWSLARAGLWGSAADGWKSDLPTPTREMVDRWLVDHPDHPDVLELAVRMELARRGGEAGDDSAELLERYARARPVDPMPHRHLARLYLAKEDPSAKQLAVEHLEFLDAREQHSPAFAIELARRYSSVRDWDRAAAKAERATRIAPFDADYREFAATMQLARGNLEEARRHLVALTRIEPDREIHRKRLEALDRKRDGAGRQ